jgi:hypothetical protein
LPFAKKLPESFLRPVLQGNDAARTAFLDRYLGRHVFQRMVKRSHGVDTVGGTAGRQDRPVLEFSTIAALRSKKKPFRNLSERHLTSAFGSNSEVHSGRDERLLLSQQRTSIATTRNSRCWPFAADQI